MKTTLEDRAARNREAAAALAAAHRNAAKVRRDLIAWFAGLPTARMKELKKTELK